MKLEDSFRRFNMQILKSENENKGMLLLEIIQFWALNTMRFWIENTHQMLSKKKREGRRRGKAHMKEHQHKILKHSRVKTGDRKTDWGSEWIQGSQW